jgi:hypothetical protein
VTISEAASKLGAIRTARKSASSRSNIRLIGRQYQTRQPALDNRMLTAEHRFGRWAIRLRNRKTLPVVIVPGNTALALVKAGEADFEAPVDREAAIAHLEALTTISTNR